LSDEAKKIKKVLISVFYKDGLLPLAQHLKQNNVEIYSTGGTRSFLSENNFDVLAIEDLTGYPSILGGRVKTLHPKVFGGILKRENNESDLAEIDQYDIPAFDLVIVDLYPFEETLKTTKNHDQIIEKIDIGGISLIRAAAKNFADVLIIPHRKFYPMVLDHLIHNHGNSTLSFRRAMAAEAFQISSAYDGLIGEFMSNESKNTTPLRYGENPHQRARFIGNLSNAVTQLNGKEISYNNILDIDACMQLLSDFDVPSCAVIKHNNACGFASNSDLLVSWQRALAGDPISAFGGIIGFNRAVDVNIAEEINKIFFEVVIATDYSEEALQILKTKKNRIILKSNAAFKFPATQIRAALGGMLEQDFNALIEDVSKWNFVTTLKPNESQIKDLLFATKLVKHTKSNAIVLVANEQLLGSGTGQTSRIDALKHAIEKAKNNNFELKSAVMASDAFFPFPDCVEIAADAGIKLIVQPGGSIKDQDSIDRCNELGLAMVITGNRHFKH